MLPHHFDLETFLHKKTREELVALLSGVYQLAHAKIAWELFGDMAYEVQLGNLNAVELQQQVATFYSDSLQKKYYAPFVWDSKDFMKIPEETEVWFNEISLLLDLTCELVFREEVSAAKFCFERLFELIERMKSGEEIIFAHEYGEWMITCRHDYKAIYNDLK